MKYKVYVPDSPTIAGGWTRVDIIEAEDEKQAVAMAKKKHGDKVMVRKVK
jgi:hypothetical protein